MEPARVPLGLGSELSLSHVQCTLLVTLWQGRHWVKERELLNVVNTGRHPLGVTMQQTTIGLNLLQPVWQKVPSLGVFRWAHKRPYVCLQTSAIATIVSAMFLLSHSGSILIVFRAAKEALLLLQLIPYMPSTDPQNTTSMLGFVTNWDNESYSSRTCVWHPWCLSGNSFFRWWTGAYKPLALKLVLGLGVMVSRLTLSLSLS